MKWEIALVLKILVRVDMQVVYIQYSKLWFIQCEDYVKEKSISSQRRIKTFFTEILSETQHEVQKEPSIRVNILELDEVL